MDRVFDMFPTFRNSARDCAPILREILTRLEGANTSRIESEFQSVKRYFRHDLDDILLFWLDMGMRGYSAGNPTHVHIVRLMFGLCGADKHPLLASFIDENPEWEHIISR